ncbi:MAG: hypothetical protein HY749_15840 [Gammaproteobacteria bacterium]|nr:hypothetical protein [Gammaproteobacteria bacterium]
MKFVRFTAGLEQLGRKESSGWEDIHAGLITRPCRLGPKANGFPDYEINTMLKARLASLPDVKLRELVIELHLLRESNLSMPEIVTAAKRLQEEWIPANASKKAA